MQVTNVPVLIQVAFPPAAGRPTLMAVRLLLAEAGLCIDLDDSYGPHEINGVLGLWAVRGMRSVEDCARQSFHPRVQLFASPVIRQL